MYAPTRAFFEHLIDYAGMFPPARLPMHEALRLYTEYAAGADAWLLGRFVCRTDQLAEFARLANGPQFLSVAALGRGGRDLAELTANLAADQRDVARFRATDPANRIVDVIEVALPQPNSAASQVLPLLTAGELRAFFEIPLAALDAWAPFLEALAIDQHAAPASGVKIRCGGATPDAIPTVEQVAAFICRCRDLRLPWKATAGLHHPLGHYDAGLQTTMHGFLNVFVAGILAHNHPLDAAEVGAILREESPAAFRFTADAFSCREWTCTAAQVRDARRWLPSFGSCSFDEPRHDLAALGLLR